MVKILTMDKRVREIGNRKVLDCIDVYGDQTVILDIIKYNDQEFGACYKLTNVVWAQMFRGKTLDDVRTNFKIYKHSYEELFTRANINMWIKQAYNFLEEIGHE